MKDVLGGKGAGLAEMTTIGIPVPPRLHDRLVDVRALPRDSADSQASSRYRSKPRSIAIEAATGKQFSDGDNPLLISVRSGARGLDARHDGDHPQSRPQRHRRRRPGTPESATRASPGTRTADSCKCTARSSSTCPKNRSTRSWRPAATDSRLSATSIYRSKRCKPSSASSRPVSAPRRAAIFRKSRWTNSGAPSPPCFELEYAPCDRLPEAARHSGQHGHRRQYRRDGLRQPRRRFRNGRRVQPRPIDRREVPLRRISTQRPG